MKSNRNRNNNSNMMMMHNGLHPRDDIDRLYVSRKEGERRLVSSEECKHATIQRLKEYTKKLADWLVVC